MIFRFFILVVIVFASFECFAQDKELKASVDRGKEVFVTNCMSCHQENGEGVEGAFPPLIKTEYVTGDTKRLITIILHGQSGEIVVNDKTYAMEMPAQSHLTDEEITDVLNYIRNSWGNQSKTTLTPAQVKSLRK
jgi:mono/diheme cytochrome c family protein